MKLSDALISILFPKKCYACDRLISKGRLCDLCKSSLVFINPAKRCIKCGLEKENCQCNYRAFYFENIIAVFEYSESARDIALGYKRDRQIQHSKFLSDYMVRAINEEYENINFSAVCYVPTSLKSRASQGYDHSKVLAKRVAKELSLPLRNALFCKSFRRSQHKSDFKKRRKNVIGKYGIREKVNGNVLLVDDIKTTGSTLDECSFKLLQAGADKVYCVTALATVFNSKENI